MVRNLEDFESNSLSNLEEFFCCCSHWSVKRSKKS